MIAPFLPFIASILPSFALPALKGWLQTKKDIATDQEVTRRETALAIITERQEAHKAKAETIQAAMHHRPFWFTWSLFTVPLGLWWTINIMDSIFLFHGNIPDLPEAIRPWADQIVGSLFLSGGGVASATLIAKAIGRR